MADAHENYLYDVPIKREKMPEDVEDSRDETKQHAAHGRESLKISSGFWQLAFKFIELVFCIVSVALIAEPAEEIYRKGKIPFHHVILAYSTFVSYIIISLLIILGRVMNEPLGLRSSILYTIVGAGLFFVTSVLLFVDKPTLEDVIRYPRDYVRNMWVASAAFALINALVFIGDTVYAFMRRDDYEE